MDTRKARELSLAFRGEVHSHLTAVVRAPHPFHQTALLQPVDQPDRAVMLQEQMCRQGPNGWRVGLIPGSDGQDHLVLLWLQIFGAGGSLAEMQETADLVTELPQSPIVGTGQVLLSASAGHVSIISYDDIKWEAPTTACSGVSTMVVW